MIIIHHLGISQSDRIVWLCEELGVAYELRRYERDPVTRMAPQEYKALTPFGTAPVITDGDVTLSESGAIIEYIIGRYGGGRLAVQPTELNYSDYLFWFHFANGSFMPTIMSGWVSALADPDSARSATLRKRLDGYYAQIEGRLAQTPHFAGESFTAADIIMLFPLTTMRKFTPRDLMPYPNIRAYLQRIASRPAFRKAMQKADPGFAIPLS